MSQLIPKPTTTVIDNFCGQCGNHLNVQDNFCRNCGTQVHGPIAVTSTSIVTATSQPRALILDDQNDVRQATGTLAKHNQQQLSNPADTVQVILNNRLCVGIVIALIGPLGLPALWFSPRFSNQTKLLLTLFFVVITAVVPLAIAWYFLDYSVRPLVEALSG